MDYKQKYLKYKNKYLQLKETIMTSANLIGGGGRPSKKEKEKNDIKTLKKYFVELVPKIKHFEVIVEPFLQYWDTNEEFTLVEINGKLKKLFSDRLKKDYNRVISMGIFQFSFDTINYDERKNELTLSFKPTKEDFNNVIRFTQYRWNFKEEYNLNDIIDIYNMFFLDIMEDPRWVAQGTAILIKKGEIDEYNYYLNLKNYKIFYKLENENKTSSNKKNRPSPSESATLFNVGAKKKGNDGNMWIIVENKNGVKRWKNLS